MSQFHVCIIFIGILLVGISFVMVLFDKKGTIDYLKKVENKHEELVGIINDAEQMVVELNKFSDYVVEKIEKGKSELDSEFKKHDNLIKDIKTVSIGKNVMINQKVHDEISNQKNLIRTKQAKEHADQIKFYDKNNLHMINQTLKKTSEVEENKISKNEGIVNKNSVKPDNFLDEKYGLNKQMENCKLDSGRDNEKTEIKLSTNNVRYNEVIALLEDGLSDAEIAKRLNIGRGEIQLIMGVNR